MKINPIHSIVFIGAGNVATHLATAFKNSGMEILQVYSRSESSAQGLADALQTAYTCKMQNIIANADLYIISLADDGLLSFAKKFKAGNKLVVHTSGYHALNAIKEISVNTGVFYPLQTFSKNRAVDFSTIPICVEANSDDNLKLLVNLAHTVSSIVCRIDSEQRKLIHLAAVFACNFTNHLYCVAEEILNNANMSFYILKPLIIETAMKAMDMNPREAQTGPARRKDMGIILQHLKMLDGKDYKEIYKIFSRMIIEKYCP